MQSHIKWRDQKPRCCLGCGYPPRGTTAPRAGERKPRCPVMCRQEQATCRTRTSASRLNRPTAHLEPAPIRHGPWPLSGAPTSRLPTSIKGRRKGGGDKSKARRIAVGKWCNTETHTALGCAGTAPLGVRASAQHAERHQRHGRGMVPPRHIRTGKKKKKKEENHVDGPGGIEPATPRAIAQLSYR